MKIESFGISHIGHHRHNNEDAWGELPNRNFYILADGMGGHQAGEIAATEAVESVLRTMRHVLSHKTSLSTMELQFELKEAILEANSWVYHLSQESSDMQGMGTTLCCLLFYENHVIFGHVGDSRIYRFQKKLECLTQDHSLRKEVANLLHLDEKAATGLPSKNIITRAIGTSSYVEPDLNSLSALSGDIYFLCSDGLSDLVSDQEMASVIKQHSTLKQIGEALVQKALENGGNDNITLVITKIL